jgi:hypothetical protein
MVRDAGHAGQSGPAARLRFRIARMAFRPEPGSVPGQRRIIRDTRMESRRAHGIVRIVRAMFRARRSTGG